jgi:hypothetical protein
MSDDGYCGDFDVTGDPVLDQDFYQSPRRQSAAPWRPQRNPTLEKAARERAERRARRQATRLAPTSPVRPAKPVEPVQPPARPVPVAAQTAPQHGAWFEVRTRRVWYAPWRTRKVWTQVGPWVVGDPPRTGEVVTVHDVSALPGRVTTLGTVGPTGAVVY